MIRFKKLMSFLMALVFVLSTVGCVRQEDPTESTSGEAVKKVDHTVSLKTLGGMAMEGIDVYA